MDVNEGVGRKEKWTRKRNEVKLAEKSDEGRRGREVKNGSLEPRRAGNFRT